MPSTATFYEHDLTSSAFSSFPVERRQQERFNVAVHRLLPSLAKGQCLGRHGFVEQPAGATQQKIRQLAESIEEIQLPD